MTLSLLTALFAQVDLRSPVDCYLKELHLCDFC